MIVLAFMQLCGGLVVNALCSLGDSVTLPFSLVSTLATITKYGSWIVGDDLLLLLVSSVVFWSGVKLIGGLTVYIWKLLPFT